MGIERENHGHAVIQKVIDLGMGDSHLAGGCLYYYSSSSFSDRAKRPEQIASKAGWSTNVITRPIMLDGLRQWIEAPDSIERVRDRQFLSECGSFRLQSDGRFAADPGSSDDSVMKWAIANQMRTVDPRGQRLGVVNVSRWR
jgi:hypothetical protein